MRACVVKQSDGSINVFIGNGQTLVLGTQTYSLSAGPSAADPQDYAVFYVPGRDAYRAASCSLQGGTLGGLLDFRSETLDIAQNKLGRVATVLAQTFNDQHASGRTSTASWARISSTSLPRRSWRTRTTPAPR